jgi:hypothetical protein
MNTISIEYVGQKLGLQLVRSVSKIVTVRTKTPEGTVEKEKKQVTKETKIVKWLNKDGIVSVEPFISERNTIIKDRSVIFDKYSGQFYATWHSVEDIMKILEGQSREAVGFKIPHRNVSTF